MKNLIITTAFVLGFSTLKANHLNSELNLKMFDNSGFTLTFDNVTYNTPSGTFGIGNINPGSHFMKVSRMVYTQFGPIAMHKTVFSGYIDIPVNAKVFSLIDFYNNYAVLNMQPNYVEPVCEDQYDDKKYYGQRGGHNGGKKKNYYEDDHKKGGKGYNKPSGMNPAEFSALKNSVVSKSFDSSKLQLAKQAIASNYLSSAQVAELVRIMTFESSKLELAKYAYSYTLDRNNYYMVNNAFTFESSIQELVNYISKIG